MFSLSRQNNRVTAILAILFLVSLSVIAVEGVRAQGGKLLPPREGSVTDFASVLDYSASKRLENMLANLKERAGIELAVVTVKNTNGKEISDYSLQAAREWNLGTMQSKTNSLLLVVSTDDGKFFTQVSRRARGELPDGLIGEMGSRMREPFGRGSYGEGLLAAIETFITKLAERRGFSVEGMDQAQSAAVEEPKPSPTATAESSQQTTTPTETPGKEPQAETTEAVAKEPAPEVTPAPKEAAPTSTPVTDSTVKDIFTKKPAAKTVTIARDTPERAELETLVKLPPAARIEKLKAFIEAHPRSPLLNFAAELVVSARAALGDERLRAGDAAAGVEQFQLAIAESPEKMSDALFTKVVSQLPMNLFMRGERTAASDAARRIEAKVKDDARRLLALSSFFLSIEDSEEATRLSDAAVKLAPDLAAAHHALGAAHHIGLKLEPAAAEYARALELDPKMAVARRSLADLSRATGKTEEALALYRQQLAIDRGDKPARAGLILSLLELGKKEEAESELAAALKDDPRNMPLLIGASYWHAAKGETARAQEFATRAIEIEPRYTWAHIALARALIAQKRALEAERVLRFARRYGNFPTLDYELANALAVLGLYEEAANELMRSFTIKDGQIETRLAGRVPAKAANFIELLAPERRAGIFQATAADTDANARRLKGLLAFALALNRAEGRSADASALTAAQADFLAGEDAMLGYRQLFTASRLLSRGVELNTVIELAENAKSHIEAGLEVPVATVAVLGDELRDARASAIASGGTLAINDVPRNVLLNIQRGRIEDLTAWAYFNQDKTSEALTHLKRALSVLPENSAWWRTAQWHLGATLEATGNHREALSAYLKGYNPQASNPVQRARLEALYRKVNGSLEGLDAKIGAASSASSLPGGNVPPSPRETPEQTPSTSEPAETKPPENEQPKTESTEQKPAQGTHPVKQP